MRTIGLLGGMSWESSLEYYRIINETVKERLGGLHSARSLMYSVDFAEVERLQHEGDWGAAGALLAEAAQQLERGGADFLVLCTNTMHRVAPQIESSVDIPLLHIADPTGAAIHAHGLRTVGLLGTRFTMEQEFYRGRLIERFELDVLVPDADDRDMIHRVIYDELCLGIVRDTSRGEYQRVVERLAGRGAQGIILGCTEIGLLLQQQHSQIRLFDTTRLHAEAAVARALGQETP